MREIVMLGTGTPVPDPDRAGSAVALVGHDDWLLVDCGRGATQRVLQAGLDPAGLRCVLLTHHHSDHVSDLATLAVTRWVAGAPGPLTVLAPEGPCARFARRCLDGYEDESFHSQSSAQEPRPSVEVLAFTPSREPAVVSTDGGWTVASALVDHHPIEAAVGYRVTSGAATVTLSGDTAVCPGLEALADGTDVLVNEALDEERVGGALLAWNAGAGAVGALADRAVVGRLVLTHLLPTPRSAADLAAFVDQARRGGYRGPVDTPADLDRIVLAPA